MNPSYTSVESHENSRYITTTMLVRRQGKLFRCVFRCTVYKLRVGKGEKDSTPSRLDTRRLSPPPRRPRVIVLTFWE